MGRKERRIQKKFEKNPIRELNKVQNRFYSQLFWKFSQTEDPRGAGRDQAGSGVSFNPKAML